MSFTISIQIKLSNVMLYLHLRLFYFERWLKIMDFEMRDITILRVVKDVKKKKYTLKSLITSAISDKIQFVSDILKYAL